MCPNFISQKVKVSSGIHLNTCKYHVCGIKHETKVMRLQKFGLRSFHRFIYRSVLSITLTIACNVSSQPV